MSTKVKQTDHVLDKLLTYTETPFLILPDMIMLRESVEDDSQIQPQIVAQFF